MASAAVISILVVLAADGGEEKTMGSGVGGVVSSPLGTMGACHCCASFPNFLCLEWHHISRWDRWNELIEEEPLIQDGYITVSEKPGIGVTPIEDAIRKTAVKDIPFFE